MDEEFDLSEVEDPEPVKEVIRALRDKEVKSKYG